jgi:N-terminal acetyltransferase B complex non-catalytic subunit
MYNCKACRTKVLQSCHSCLDKLVCDVSQTLQDIANDKDAGDAISRGMDPRPDMSLTAAVALLKLSGLGSISNRKGPPINTVNIPRLLQAALLLDFQLQNSPDEVPIRLLLVKLYLLLGCGTVAHPLWSHMDVKRTIQDALSPLFFDRVSSIAPTLFHSTAGKPLMGSLTSYYRNSLRDPAPVMIWDAFSAGSYASILDMAGFNHRLRHSCTRVMTIVEERRGMRAFGGRVEDLEDVPLFSKSLLFPPTGPLADLCS